MRICLLTYDDSEPDATTPGSDVRCDPRPFLPEAEWVEVELEKPTAAHRILQLSQDGFDLFFNFCDGAWDSSTPGIEVVQTLERLDVPFTGAASSFYDPSREAMKRVCAALGIDAPPHVLARSETDLERATDTLRFPLIVKHPSSYSSIGLTPESRVGTVAALREQAGILFTAYGGALVEEFIDGEEATVLVAENADDPLAPLTYTPIRYRFPEGETFKHYHLKWVAYHGLEGRPVHDPTLEAGLREISARMFAGLGGTGYGRCDIRIAPDGRLFMLEINPNCGVYYPASDPGSADLCLLHDPRGPAGFTRDIVAAAFSRPRAPRLSFEIRSNGTGDYGHYARRDLRPGERIAIFEDTPHTLVTRSHVERNWNGIRLDWFRRYAWPLTDEVWVAWSRDPEEWRPINHSCDPNAWLDGLDVVARREIPMGAEITLDYATFYNEIMPPFECHCGTPACRGTITGQDHLADFVERYGPHVSEYVARKRLGR
jgi:D-alanine-D-alanine ligase-like ATP-grasp enzyme